MSSDEEDYDGDTNWDEIVAISETLSQQRRVPGGINSTALEPSVAALRPAVQDTHAGTSRVNENSRRQAILAALSSEIDKTRGPETSAINGRKRKRSIDKLDSPTNKQPHLVRSPAGAGVQKILSGYDDELSCPICLDFFLAPQLLNPCGHTLCGDCLDHWLDKSTNRECPSCRVKLSYTLCNLPNFAISGTVDRYIELQRANQDADWLDGGAKWKERQSRKRAYEVVKEMNKKPVPAHNTNWRVRLSDLLDTEFDPLQRHLPNPSATAGWTGTVYGPARTGGLSRTADMLPSMFDAPRPLRRPNAAERQTRLERPSAPGTNRRGSRRRAAATTSNTIIEISSDEEGLGTAQPNALPGGRQEFAAPIIDDFWQFDEALFRDLERSLPEYNDDHDLEYEF